jgi:hypothetical protein
MSIDGNCGFVYCGAVSLGIGTFVVENGKVRGIDYGGGRYDGIATLLDDQRIHIKVNFRVPANGELVQGVSPQSTPYTKVIEETFPPSFGDGKPLEASNPPVTVMIKRLPHDDPLPTLLGLT